MSKSSFAALFDDNSDHNGLNGSDQENQANPIPQPPPPAVWVRAPRIKKAKTPKLPFEQRISGKVGELDYDINNNINIDGGDNHDNNETANPTVNDIINAYIHFLEPISELQGQISINSDHYNFQASPYVPDNAIKARFDPDKVLPLQSTDLDLTQPIGISFTYFGANHNGQISPLGNNKFIRVHPEHHIWLLRQYEQNFHSPNLTYLSNLYWYVLEEIERRKRCTKWNRQLEDPRRKTELIDTWRDELAIDFFFQSLHKQSISSPLPSTSSEQSESMLLPSPLTLKQSDPIIAPLDPNSHLERLHKTKALFHHKYDTNISAKPTDNGKIIQFYIGPKPPVATRIVNSAVMTYCLLEPLQGSIYAIIDYGHDEYGLTWIPEHCFVQYGQSLSDYTPAARLTTDHTTITQADIHNQKNGPELINFALKLYNQAVIYMINSFKRDAIGDLRQFQITSEISQSQHQKRDKDQGESTIPSCRCKSCFQHVPVHMSKATFAYSKPFRTILDDFLVNYCGNNGIGYTVEELNQEQRRIHQQLSPPPPTPTIQSSLTQTLFHPQQQSSSQQPPAAPVELPPPSSLLSPQSELLAHQDDEHSEPLQLETVTAERETPPLFSLLLPPPPISYEIAQSHADDSGFKIHDDDMLLRWIGFQTSHAYCYRLDCLNCYNKAVNGMYQYRLTAFERIIATQQDPYNNGDSHTNNESNQLDPNNQEKPPQQKTIGDQVKIYGTIPMASVKYIDFAKLGDGRDSYLSYISLDELF